MLGLLLLSLVTGSPPPPPTMSGFVDAAKLISMCQAEGPDAMAGQSICVGYVIGAVDQLMAQQARRDGPSRTICPPKAMTVNEAVAAVVKYSRFGKTAQGIGAASFIRFAMEDTYPCQVRGAAQ
jgi:hypothetical protein